MQQKLGAPSPVSATLQQGSHLVTSGKKKALSGSHALQNPRDDVLNPNQGKTNALKDLNPWDLNVIFADKML